MAEADANEILTLDEGGLPEGGQEDRVPPGPAGPDTGFQAGQRLVVPSPQAAPLDGRTNQRTDSSSIAATMADKTQDKT